MARYSLPPGFRFRPTDQELVCYYLKRKVCGRPLKTNAISEIELYKCEPWDLPGKAYLQSRDLEWFFFCPRDRKYPNGCRIKRATDKGFWKTTGNDRAVTAFSRTVGMKRTLVYHKGRAPRSERTNWVMHEYRLEDMELNNANIIQDSYVLCRVFQKSGAGPRNGEQYGAPFREEDWLEDIDHEAVAMTSAERDHVTPAPRPMNSLTLNGTNEQGNATPEQAPIQDHVSGAAEVQSTATDDYSDIHGFLLECIADDLKLNSEGDESVQKGADGNLKQDVFIPHGFSTCTEVQSEDGEIFDDLEDINLCGGKDNVVRKIEDNDVINFNFQDNVGTEQEGKSSLELYLPDLCQPWSAVLDGCFLELNDLVNPMEPNNFAPETVIQASDCSDDLAAPLMAFGQNEDLDRNGVFPHIAPSSLCSQDISATEVSDGTNTMPHGSNGLQEAYNADGEPYWGQIAETAGTPILTTEQWMDSNTNNFTSGETYDAENAPSSAVTQHLSASMLHTKESANSNTRSPSKLGMMLGSIPARPASAAEIPLESKYFTQRSSFSSLHVTTANARVKGIAKHFSGGLGCSHSSGIADDSLEETCMSNNPVLSSVGFKSSNSVLERKKARSAQSDAICAVVWFLILGATVALGKCISKLLVS